MERYRLIKEIGDGTCGSVYKAVNLEKSEIVAIKRMKRKFHYWEECMNLREVKLLQKLNHPNIIKLKEIVKENSELFLIFEHMDYNLYQVIRDCQRPFSESEIRSLMSQVLQGLSYMHRNGYFHRDLKPENLLVKNEIIKIADFGLAREVMSWAPYTDYVSTRWYRAPEVLLQSSAYSPAIDMWAVGAILAELFTLYPLFPGESVTDQIYKICTVLGSPDSSIWPEGMGLSRALNFNFFQAEPANFSDIMPNASPEAIDLIQRLCSWDPYRRLTAEQALQHPFFHLTSQIPWSFQDPLPVMANKTGSTPKLELNLWDFGNESDECCLGLTLAVKPSVPNQGLVAHVGFSLGALMQILQGINACMNSKPSGEEFLFCSGYQAHSGQLVFWPLVSPDNNLNEVPMHLNSSYMRNSQTSLPPVSIQESSPFAISPLQPNLVDCHLFGQMMSLSSPIQQSFFFQ